MRRALLALLILSTAARAAVEPSPGAAAQPAPGFAEARVALEASLIPAARTDLAAHADLPLYRIAARWDAARRLLVGTAVIAWRNASAEPVSDLGFNTFPDCACYNASSLTLGAVRVDGQVAAPPRVVADGAAMLMDLAQPIAPGAWAEIEVPFALAPSRRGGYHGLDSDHGAVVCLYGWYPQLATRLDGAWDVHPLGGLCDPTATSMAHLIVDLDLPAGTVAATGGSVVDERVDDERRRLTIAGAFTRDLVLVIAERFERSERRVGATTVVSWCLPGDAPGGAAALDVAARSLELYAPAFGAYPYAELDAVQVPLGDDVGGMESSGLVLIDSACYRSLRPYAEDSGANPPLMSQFMMAMCVSHEVGHQWWYGLVGSDAWASPWLDESMTSWTGCWYLEAQGGPLADAGWTMSLAESGPPSAVTMPATRTAGDYAEMDYGAVVYGRGALMYQALRRQMGEQAFFAFLRAWADDHRYGRGDDAAWRAALAQAIGADAAAAFTRKWLDAQGLTRRDLAAASRRIVPARPQPAARQAAVP